MHHAQADSLGPIVPLALIISIVLVSGLAWVYTPLKAMLILNPYRVREKMEVYRLATAGWLHADVSHLAFNMFALYLFGEASLRGLGTARFLALYVSAVIVAFIPTTLRYMKRPSYNSLGASGAIAAVMFSAILLDPKLKVYVMFIPVAVPGVIFAIGYLAYSAWRSHRAGDNVNHDAHFAGALYGGLLTFVLEPAQVERTLRSFF